MLEMIAKQVDRCLVRVEGQNIQKCLQRPNNTINNKTNVTKMESLNSNLMLRVKKYY